MKKSQMIIGGGIVALLIIVIILLMTGTVGRGPGGRGDERHGDFTFFREGREGFLTPSQMERLMAKGASPQAELELFKSHSQYPNDSRPLTAGMKDLLDPWKVEQSPLPAPLAGASTEAEISQLLQSYLASGKSQEDAEKEIAAKIENQPAYQFTLSKHTITEGDSLTATLKITKNGSSLPYTISSAELESDVLFGQKGLGSISYNDAGTAGDQKAGDGITTFNWKSPSADKLYWGTLTIKVKVNITGVKDQVVLQQSFYSSPRAPAVFLEQFAERVVDGSLVIDVSLDVRKECRYNLQANLFSLDENEPTHWAVVQKVLEPGRQIVSFTFFGKIFRDGGYTGKFQLRDLRGTCENLPFPPKWLGDPSKLNQITNTPASNEPPLIYIPYNQSTYTTRAYNSTDFSDRPFTSEEIQQRLRELEEAAKK